MSAENPAMASSKREFQNPDEVASSKKPKLDFTATNVQPSLTDPPPRVTLNPADCEIDFDIGLNGLQGSALHEKAFAYFWSGARANAGITGGKYCFGCKIISEQRVSMVHNTQDQQHLCRVGVSRVDDPVGDLGESLHSFCFEATGDIYNAGKVSCFGESFGVRDEIICCLDLETSNHASIGFLKNRRWLRLPIHFEIHPNLGSAFFPHILLKNVVVSLQFSVEDGLDVIEGYKPWSSAIEDGKALPGPTFSNIHGCELKMLVGLPASGKSTWAEKLVKEQPEKRYIVIGTSLIHNKMKVPGLARGYIYNEVHVTICNTLLLRASNLPRNFILDRRNLYKIDRMQKLEPFSNYKKSAVVIFPRPEELKLRFDLRFKQMGMRFPDALQELLVNFSLPMSKDMPCADECFDEVIFTEMGREEAQRYLDLMKTSVPRPGPGGVIYTTPTFPSTQPCFRNSSLSHGVSPTNPPPHLLRPMYMSAAAAAQYGRRVSLPHGNFPSSMQQQPTGQEGVGYDYGSSSSTPTVQHRGRNVLYGHPCVQPPGGGNALDNWTDLDYLLSCTLDELFFGQRDAQTPPES
ncbi:unnamed protein product [Cuscuta europaea]|uniref:SPRY domain-containing protein n=1 Tax=Cuscuta europaea TaxID=41803 RepID=A0A9P0YIV4_CUSEU|nr:unnamed protein product [Cuscuta europaea]